VSLKPRLGLPASGARRAEPITFGVPLPSGFVTDGRNWRLTASSGATSPVQTRVLDRWRDGTARWILVDAIAEASLPDSSEYTLEEAPGPKDPGLHRDGPVQITVREDGSGIEINTGAAQFLVSAGGSFPFATVRRAGAPMLDPARTGLRIVDRSGAGRAAVISSVHVEDQGPLRTVLLIKGVASAGSAGQTLFLTARLHFFAGLSTVRLLITLTNPNNAIHTGGFWDLGDPGSILIKSADLTLTGASGTSGLRVSPEIAAPGRACDLAFELYQDSSGGDRWQSTNHINRERRVPTTFRGYRMRCGGHEESGLRATPCATLGALSAAVPDFWQNFPRSIEADGQALTLGLFPGQFGDLHEIQGGEQKTYECFLSFGGDQVSEEPLAWCRSRLVPSVDPAWVLASGAVPFLAPLSPEHAALVNTAVDGPDSFERKREVIDEYGWRHFGEIYGDHESVRQTDPPIVSHYNNQYDPIAGFVWQFLRTGDTRWWTMAAELASHIIDIDVYHTMRDKAAYNHGLFWHTYHYGDADTASHRTYPKAAQGRTHGGGPSADHNYTTGLMLHYFLTGDEASRQTVVDLAQFVIDIDDGRKTVFRWLDPSDTGRASLSAGYYGPGRGPANSVNALIDGARLSGDRRFFAKAEQLIRRVVHPLEDVTRHRLDDPEERWFYTMFLQSLGKYLHAKVELGEFDDSYAYGRASLLHYARWMAVHEYPILEKPEKVTFPTETWAAQDIRKSDVLHYAATHADEPERSTLTARAEFFHRTSTATLAEKPTRALARPVIVLLTSGFVQEWRHRHPDAAEPPATVTPVWAPPGVFVPQRARAERRLKFLAAVVFGIGTLGAAWLLF
jgi:hypothetical protein